MTGSAIRSWNLFSSWNLLSPAFSLLAYPQRVLDERTGELLPQIRLSEKSPPAFIVHTHDDASSSLECVPIDAGLKRHNVAIELHGYETRGHG